MNTRSALNAALLGLAAVLAALIYWQPGIKPPAVLPKLTALAPADIQHIAIRPQQGAEIRLDKEQGNWMMSAPIATYANGFRIDALLGVAQAESHARLAVAGLDLAKYHLDTPALVLRLNDVELAFGDSEPLDNRRYVRVGSAIHLINDEYFYRLQAGVPAFVSNQLLPPDSKPVRISLPAFSVSRTAGQWQLAPAEKPPSMDALNGFVAEWQRAQAVEVDRYESGGATKGKIAISFEGGAAPLEFLLLQTEPEPVLARADLGLRYHLAAEQAQHLLQPPSAATPAAHPE